MEMETTQERAQRIATMQTYVHPCRRVCIHTEVCSSCVNPCRATYILEEVCASMARHAEVCRPKQR